MRPNGPLFTLQTSIWVGNFGYELIGVEIITGYVAGDDEARVTKAVKGLGQLVASVLLDMGVGEAAEVKGAWLIDKIGKSEARHGLGELPKRGQLKMGATPQIGRILRLEFADELKQLGVVT